MSSLTRMRYGYRFYDQVNPRLEPFFHAASRQAKYSSELNGRKRQALLRYLMISLENQSSTLSRVSSSPSCDYIALHNWFEENLHEAISLADMAAIMHQPVSRFSENFTYRIGVSPKRYLAKMRMLKACFLLRETSLEIKEISQRVGYSRVSAFYRAYKRYLGQSPRHFQLRDSELTNQALVQ